MSAQHTPGRLTVRENGDANSYAIMDDAGQWLLHNGRQTAPTQSENLRRLVACWNACDGLHTESLECGKPLADQIVDALNQRDELLESLKDCLRRIADDEEYGPDHAVTKARAAIAKVGGAA